jgi:aconitate hydratase
LTGELYPPAETGLSLKNCDHLTQRRGVIVSPESLAFAVAHGHLGDPRGFKRPVRVTVPRNLPTDDVLLIRGTEARGGAKGKGRVDHRAAEMADSTPSSDHFSSPAKPRAWGKPIELDVIAGRSEPKSPCAFVAASLEDIRWLIERAPVSPELRAVIAEHIPAASVSVLSGLGVLALRADEKTIAHLVAAKKLRVPGYDDWDGQKFSLDIGKKSVSVDWLAVGPEREWTSGN